MAPFGLVSFREKTVAQGSQLEGTRNRNLSSTCTLFVQHFERLMAVTKSFFTGKLIFLFLFHFQN